MSARITRSVAATLAASALLGSAALAFPAAANAATPAPKSVLKITATATAQGTNLQPGGAARSEIVKVTNNTGKAQSFHGELLANPAGAVYLKPGEIAAQVTALGKTPATRSAFINQAPGVIGAFFPKGHTYGAFTIPAHTTFSWKVSLEATKNFPLNDEGVDLYAEVWQRGTSPAYAKTNFRVGNGHTGGPVVEKLGGDVELTAYNHPAFMFLTVTNHTGATLPSWQMLPWINQKPGARLAVDVWVGSATKGHWRALTSDLNAAGLANGASKTFELRVRVLSYNGKTNVHDVMYVENWDGAVAGGAPQWGLLVH